MKCPFCDCEMIEKVEYEDKEIRRTVFRCPNGICNKEREINLKRMREELKKVLG